MGVVVKLDSKSEVHTILYNIKSLARTPISIERDISQSKVEDKRIMLHLKKEIEGIDATQLLLVREDRLEVGDKFFQWNMDKELTCGRKNGKEAFIKGIYGNKMEGLDLSYYYICNKLQNNIRNN